MIGLGLRREMLDWDMSSLKADFFEIVPENWLRRDRALLHALRDLGYPIYLHSVSLNLGGTSPINEDFLKDIRSLMNELDSPYYSDHLAASGDAHQLYDLFPIPLTENEVKRVGDRIAHAQDVLGLPLSIENSTWYTNRGDIPETEFINQVLKNADCRLLLDLNNISVNHKNHQLIDLQNFVSHIDMSRVSYLHVAGHEFDPRFNMFIDTHSCPVETQTQQMARSLSEQYNLDILLEWDNDVPDSATLNKELECLAPSMIS